MLSKREQTRIYNERKRSKPGYKEKRRKYFRSYYKLNREKIRAYQTEYQRKYRHDPEKRLRLSARRIVKNYIANGSIKRKPCSGCGNKKAESHHPDYAKPLEIVWLCRACHLKEHGIRSW